MQREDVHAIAMKDVVRVEELGVVKEAWKEKIMRWFDYEFFKEISEIIKKEGEKFNDHQKSELVLGNGWHFYRAEKVQDALAKSRYGDVFIAHTTKLAEIKKNRIALSITSSKDVKDLIRNPKKYLKERVSVNYNLEGQLCFEEIFELQSIISSEIKEKYDITGVMLYHMDDENRLELLKIVFFDPSFKKPLLILHAPISMLYLHKDELANQDSKIFDKDKIKEEELSLKKTLKFK
ncbi:hypothetical protein [Thermotalea metallivorans]|uniref:Uncharacterized protein n=1 Tax=Thermotalea metallivorans TaxID=520762 RepID=A0A140KZV1_9FIRM|nr:hypothetical protein [Thermotalea metallivorans]KXG73826.1 hypothetical protein AN619_28600 [Thermotalea metallivorans]